MHDIIVGICSDGKICVETMTSLIAAVDTVKQRDLSIGITVQVGGNVDRNRNACVEVARETGASHLMFIDTDMIFPTSGILRLYDHDKDIVGANYNMRGNPSTGDLNMCTVKMADEKGNLLEGVTLPKQLFRCHAIATGFMMINMRVFEAMSRPYFYFIDDGTPDLKGEDVNFCVDAGKAGFEIWCSPTIRMGHIGSTVY